MATASFAADSTGETVTFTATDDSGTDRPVFNPKWVNDNPAAGVLLVASDGKSAQLLPADATIAANVTGNVTCEVNLVQDDPTFGSLKDTLVYTVTPKAAPPNLATHFALVATPNAAATPTPTTSASSRSGS